MKMLLWKDYRLSRFALLAGVMLLGMPYLILLFPYVEFPAMWFFSTGLSKLTMAIVAGNIIACERTDRSATFLAYQGVSRRMLISSKLIICISTFIAICAIPAILSLWLPEINNSRNEPLSRRWEFQGICAVVGMGFFGISWLMSSLLSSYGLPILIGIISPYIITLFLGATLYVLNVNINEDYLGKLALTFLPIVGLISLVAGTWYFLHSKES